MDFQQLVYPLNVYACLLQLEYGSVESLHFGIGMPQRDYPAAQRALTRLLLSHLPQQPAVIVDVGCGTGTLAAQLAAQGHRVIAISNNADEVISARRNAPEAEVVLADFADLRPSEPADVVVMEHSAQYFDSLLLLSKARQWLPSGGSLLLVDEFVLQDHQPLCNGRPLLGNFLQQAVRSGYTIVSAQELGTEVAPGLLHLGRLLQQHRSALMAAVGVSALQLQALEDGFSVQAERMATAVTGYLLLALHCPPIDATEPVFGDIHSFDMAEVAPLFESSFDSPFDPAVWQWKYGGGRGRAVSARVNNELVAHYGGASRDILCFGEPRKAMQICDVMVMPQHRSFVSRDTLFFKTAATFLEQYIGNVAEYLLGFGFPNQRILRMARRLGLYDVTDSFVELHYAMPEHLEHEPGLSVQPFALEQESSRALIDDLWSRMAPSFAGHIIGVRDWGYLHYRYCSHPLWRQGYDSMLVSAEAGQPLALVVLKRLHGARLLMDIVAAPGDFSATVAALVSWLARDGERLLCRITHAHAERLMLPGAHIQSLDIEIPCSIWSRGPATESLRGQWWLTAGDMDFV